MTSKKNQPAGLALRLIAIERLRRVLANENFTPFTAGEIGDSRDRALANKLITTALRRQGHIDIVIGELLEKGMPAKSGSFEAALRLALAQLIYLPDLGAHSALFLAVEAVKSDKKAQHLAGLMNAVLRRAQANSARYSQLPDNRLLPDLLGKQWDSVYGEAAVDAFAEALLAGAPLDLTLRDDDAELVASLGAEKLFADSVRIATRDRPVDELPGYEDGRWWVQDAASALPARLLDLASGARVLDLCAAPGGKTAQLIKAGYSVTALDNDSARIARLEANLKRLGYSAEIVTADAGTYAGNQQFDGVLLDAPCSATGTFRRHPEVIWHRSKADITGRVTVQRRLLTNALRCLKPGGTLIYCVCSLEPEEGEAQVDWVLATMPELTLSPIAPAEVPGLETAISDKGALRTHPAMNPAGQEGGMDGFFVARFKRA